MDFNSAPKYVQQTILDTIAREGGVSNDPDDKGGLTKCGITQETAKVYGFTNVMSMTLDEIKSVYLNEYYLKYHIDLIAEISNQLAEELFDTGVNVGSKTPIKWLQSNLNLLNNQQTLYEDIDVDGVVGTQTVTALNAFIALRGKEEGEKVLYNQLNSLQAAYYYSLALANVKYEKFYFGWLSKRCNYIA